MQIVHSNTKILFIFNLLSYLSFAASSSPPREAKAVESSSDSSSNSFHMSQLVWYLPISSDSSFRIHASDSDQRLVLETDSSISALDYEKVHFYILCPDQLKSNNQCWIIPNNRASTNSTLHSRRPPFAHRCTRFPRAATMLLKKQHLRKACLLPYHHKEISADGMSKTAARYFGSL